MKILKWGQRVIVLILVCCLLLPAPAQAATPDLIQPYASSYYQQYFIYTYAAGNGKIQVWFEILGHHRMNEIGVLRIVLQESPDQSSWVNVATFSYADNYDEMMSENAVTHFGHVDYNNGTPGKYYRARLTLYATDDEGYETALFVTDAVLCT